MGWLTSYGDVEMLAIDGDEEFKSGAWYAEDAEVIVAYHTFPNKTTEKGKENVTSVSDDEEHNKESDEVATIYEAAVGKMAHDIYSELSVLGYDIEFSHEVTKIDFTSEVLASDESEDYNIPWLITKLDDFDTDAKKAIFFINTQEMLDEAEAKDEMEQNLSKKIITINRIGYSRSVWK